MTVWDALLASPPSGSVVSSWGSPVSGTRQEANLQEEMKSGSTYEMHYYLNPKPRDLTKDECAAVLPSVVNRFAIEHPYATPHYADVRYETSSPAQQVAAIQFSVHTPLAPLAILVPALVAILIAAVAAVVFAVVVAPALKIAYTVLRSKVPSWVTNVIWLFPIGVGAYFIYRWVKKK
jgi:hypothetical protein